MERSATISDCGKYRYDLWRRWDNTLPVCVFVGLNPSTADATVDDPTIKRCVDFATQWMYGSLCMVNLFAFRATDPQEMLKAEDPVGFYNDEALQKRFAEARIIVCAWGKLGSHRRRDSAVMDLIPSSKRRCLKLNRGGSPSHTLYLPANLKPVPFPDLRF